MRNTFLATALAVGATLVAAVSTHAQAVSYLPSNHTILGTASQSFTLSVFGPANLAKGSKAVISVAATNTAAPAGVAKTAIAAAIKISPASVTFTGPSQTANVTVTVTPPSTTGNYQWLVLATGWPSAVTNPGCVVNLQDYLTTNPVASITYPSNGETIYVTSSTFSLGVPVGIDATSATGAFPVTSVASTATGPGFPSVGTVVALTSSGLGTNSVVSDGTLTVTQLGTYTVKATAKSAVGSSTATAIFTVALPPTLPPITDKVVWQPPLSTTTTFSGGSQVSVAFTIVNTTNGSVIVDPNIQVSIYPLVNSIPGTAKVYYYSSSPTYTVSASTSVYSIAWPTATGSNEYRADVDLNVNYQPPATGSTLTKLSSDTFYTQ